ncbi:acyltransferase [Geothrix sp. PMB-07]|uniref:acyltransferase n=1 Tax=Geothrix sp. PMB-07 TaxID=3068640 RepID=UPI002740D86D|nr:acyltransferase [Geothrix sp. PMB-07]WLT31800.1 acyltransferase [Geothrix sp. PMB-07]
MPRFIHPTAVIDEGALIGEGTRIWHFSHILPGTVIGSGCTLGQNVMAGPDVKIGNHCKIQNNVSLYNGVELEDYVFCGPSMVFTNIPNPRCEFPQSGAQHNRRTLVRRGASIGANATLVCGVTVGRYAFIGAGAVVASDVPDYGLMLGVPARQAGWMSRHGARLPDPDAEGVRHCPLSGWRYLEQPAGTLRCLDWPEDQPLNPNASTSAGVNRA